MRPGRISARLESELNEADRCSDCRELLVSMELRVLDQDDPRMELARASQLHEVIYVRRHQDTVLQVRAFEHDLVLGTEHASIAHMARVEAVGSAQGLCDRRRQVLIEQ